MSSLLFVYGTLKEGFPNHGINTGRRVEGVYRTRQSFPMYVVKLPHEDRAPWLVDSPGDGHRVSGQIFEVDSTGLQAMDLLEEVGLPEGYVRVEIDVESADEANKILRVFAYMKQAGQFGKCLAQEGPFDEYTAELAVGYRLSAAG